MSYHSFDHRWIAIEPQIRLRGVWLVCVQDAIPLGAENGGGLLVHVPKVGDPHPSRLSPTTSLIGGASLAPSPRVRLPHETEARVKTRSSTLFDSRVITQVLQTILGGVRKDLSADSIHLAASWGAEIYGEEWDIVAVKVITIEELQTNIGTV